MVHSAKAHLSADFFSKRDESDSQYCRNLLQILVLRFDIFVFGTEVKHFLDLDNVTRASVSASHNDNFSKVFPFLTLKDF